MTDRPFFFSDLNDDGKYYVPIAWAHGILTRTEWKEISQRVTAFYRKSGIDAWIEKYNSPEECMKRQEEREAEVRRKSKESSAEAVLKNAENSNRYFYIGKIKNATPDTIIKIGIAKDKSRLNYYIDRYGDCWELVGIWFIKNAIKFERDIREKYKGRGITTGKDFFYLTDDEINTICKMATSVEIARL